MIPLIIAAAAFLPMIAEAVVSSRHERVLRAQGAVEPHDDVIGAMRLAYPGGFAAIVAEAWLRQPEADGVFRWGVAVFLAAKALKYWAIATLGTRWTFRVLVPRQSVQITSGPYAFMQHPNYAGVTGELVGATLMAHAWIAGPIATVGFGLLMLARIRVEERTLRLESRR